MTSPQNARTLPGGIRVYSWPGSDGAEPVDVLSVTTIRRLCGVTMPLVNWQIANVVNLATGSRRMTFVGPRGGVKEKYVADGEWPGEFARRLADTNGDPEKIAELRRWLRDAADEPRDVAATRGSVVHKMIELNARLDQLTPEYITAKFEEQWASDKRKTALVVTEDDQNFVVNCMRQFWDMRAHVPFVILSAEPQVWNLTHGYAGSFDVLMWFLPPGVSKDDVPRQPTADDIRRIGGEVVLGDWKTSKDTYPDHAVQVTAYLAAEFVGSDGVKDDRLTAILHATMRGALVHIRPDEWSVEYIDFREDVLRAFLGSCAFARFLAMNPTLDNIVTERIAGKASGTEEVAA